MSRNKTRMSFWQLMTASNLGSWAGDNGFYRAHRTNKGRLEVVCGENKGRFLTRLRVIAAILFTASLANGQITRCRSYKRLRSRVHVFSHEVVVTLSTGHVDCYFASYFHVQNKIYNGKPSFMFNEEPCHDTWDRDLELIADFYIILVVYRIESVCPIKIHSSFTVSESLYRGPWRLLSKGCSKLGPLAVPSSIFPLDHPPPLAHP